MLWVGLLAAYLLSYILAFTDRGSRFAPWAALVVVPLACYGAWHFGAIGYTAFLPELYIGFSILFFGGWIVHSRLYRMRPDADGLTRYYLMIALGGAAGGAACSFLMPLVTNIVAEYPIALAMILGVVILDCRDGIAFVVQRPAVQSYIERTSDTDLKQLHAFLLSLTTPHTAQNAPHPAQSTKHTAQSIPHPAHCTKHTAQSIPHPAHCTLHKAQSTTILLLSAFALYGIVRGYNAEGRVLCRYRNFYGLGYVAHKMMSVDNGNDYEANEFRSNGTIHGFQCARGKWKSQVPTVYYAEHAGGLPILKHPNRTPHTAQSTPHPAQSTLHKAQSTLHPAQSTKHKAQDSAMRVALCGMGIGTLASYAREGDFYRFYEINPAVAKIASDERYYTFLSEASGKVEVVLDDARHALAREVAANEPKYDVIVVDVFNGDAIPPHMATREAFQIYLDRLAPNGILAFHLSNWHLDLLPMVKAAAKEFNLSLEAYVCRPTLYAYASTWAFLSREPLPPLYDEKAHDKIDLSTVGDIPLMTDDFHSLLPYLRLNVSVKKKE